MSDDPATSSAATADPQPKQTDKRQPREALPTPRVAFDKQIKCLLAYAHASEDGSKPVPIEQVAKAVEMNPSTVSLTNPFFLKVGLLDRAGRAFVPTPAVLDFARAYQWDSARAADKLAPALERSWFFRAIRPKLQLRPMDLGEVIHDLADQAGVSPEYRSQLMMLVQYMDYAGLIRRDGNQVTLNRVTNGGRGVEVEPPAPKEEMPPPRTAVQESVPGDGVRFSVTVNIDMKELSGWPADRIAALFKGLADVLAAQRGTNG